jgi:hypothetical protein
MPCRMPSNSTARPVNSKLIFPQIRAREINVGAEGALSAIVVEFRALANP